MKIVYTTGVFDLLHIGHLSLPRTAKALDDIEEYANAKRRVA